MHVKAENLPSFHFWCYATAVSIPYNNYQNTFYMEAEQDEE